MKELFLIRHAKSSWSNPGLMDEERPLNNRGHRDAPFMASFLRSQSLIPSHLISSPAVRAFMTAEYFKEEFEAESIVLYKESDLYFGSEDEFLYIINSLDESVLRPAFFSHNPALTYFANRFTKNWFDNVPTCGIVHLVSAAESWEDLYFDNTILKNLFVPKKVRKEI